MTNAQIAPHITFATAKSATLIFKGEQLVALPRVAQMMEQSLSDKVTITDASLTSLTIATADMTLELDMHFGEDETHLTVTAMLPDSLADHQDALLAGFARLFYAMSRQMPATHVIWVDSKVRIPQQAFIEGLAGAMGFAAPKPVIQPRRVTRAKAPSRARLPRNGGPRLAIDNANRNAGHRFDDHVDTYEAHLRATLLKDASDEEIEELRALQGAMPTEARLSAWAMSLAAATVALPIAAPVIAYNVVKGEDMRAASLAMGLAGFFLALNTSGAMAGLM